MSYNFRKKNYVHTYKDFHKKYKKKKRDEGVMLRHIIKVGKYEQIMRCFFLLLSAKIIEDAFTFVMPYGLGNIFIAGKRRTKKNAPVNWYETLKQKKLIRHTALNTFGYFYYIKWDRNHVSFRNKIYYRFRSVNSAKGDVRFGRKGLKNHIQEVTKDPYRKLGYKRYNAIR